ncbi:MAG: tetratricopeptide repeat protein, partial [Pseudomonadota bacterium]
MKTDFMISIPGIVSLVIILLSPVSMTLAQEGTPAGEIVNCTGEITVIRAETGRPVPAHPGMVLSAGDGIRTGDTGWAALLMSDETLVQINRNTVFILKRVADSAGWFKNSTVRPASAGGAGLSEYSLKTGEAWFRNKNKNMSIIIDCPSVTAGIRGTELNLVVAPDRDTVLSVIEGRVSAANPAGTVMAQQNEQVTARPGLPLEKTLLLNPADAVQWTITLPPLAETWLTMADPDPELLDLIRSRRMIIAQKSLETIVKAHPENAAAWSWLALVRLFRNQKDQALEAARKGAALAPASASGLIILSYAWQGIFDLEKALETLDQALNLEPDNCLALVNAARLRFGTQAVDMAESLMARARTLYPNDPDVLTLSGYLALARQDYDKAMDAFSRAIAINPQVGEAFMGLALLNMRRGSIDLALKEIATAVLLEPQRSVFVSYWAKMLYQVKRFDRALELLDTAQTLDA